MGKYDPLAAYLARQRQAVVDLSFRDIERLVSGILPKAARKLEWWIGHHPSQTEPQKIAWGAAGFHAEPDLKHERVRFIRKPASVVGHDT
ncbi:toxin-antitoxin system, antitoxin component [Brevundimonas sp.]|jgi:hypothetical protein|uniref:DUF7662 domain-containing protein n=1 Tax=Brevundimonas sp. TaxID=1871086 RepID=UPI0037BE34AF